jgi:hypothetical protein
MPRTKGDRDRRKRAPEEVAIESWVEDLGVYLTLPGDDPLPGNADIAPATTHAAVPKS